MADYKVASMKIFHITKNVRVVFGGGNIMRLTTAAHQLALTHCDGWMYQHGMCHIHVRGFGLGLTINFPARARRV